MPEYSVSPSGEQFALPNNTDYAAEFERVRALAAAARKQGQEVVVVMGLGFVGAVMAAIVADTVDKKNGRPASLQSDANGLARAAIGKHRC